MELLWSLDVGIWNFLLMNLSLMSLELSVVALGLLVLLADLWLPAERRRALGYTAAGVLTLLLINSFIGEC